MQTQLADFIKVRPEQTEIDSILRSCVHCGFCTATCPTYQLLGDELDGPRGRIYLLKQMLEGQDVTEHTRVHLDRCLTCRACETACPSGVRYGRLLDLGREILEQRMTRPFWDVLVRRLVVGLFAYPKRFALALTFGRLLKPLLYQHWQDKIPKAEQSLLEWPSSQHDRKMLVLDGCVQSVLTPEINSATATVLDKLGITAIKLQKQQCCGALAHHLSVNCQSMRQIKRNIDNWLPYLDQGVEAIVSTASGCGVMVKDYAEVLRYDQDYADKAARISAATKDISEILRGEDLSAFASAKLIKVAFLSPCTLQHGQQLAGLVESILKQLGFTLTRVRDAHLCCGSAGVYSLLQPDISQRLRDNKLSALQEGQPDVIATANVGCLNHLQSESPIKTMHWIQLLV